jgi:hypothetical protein
MDILPAGLGSAAAAARDRLADLSRTVAGAGIEPSGVPGSGMAAAASEAVFADALLAAMHARLEELRNVAR